MRGFDSDVVSLHCHPSLPRILIGLTLGTLQLWDYEDRILLLEHRFALPLGVNLPSTATSADDVTGGGTKANLPKQGGRKADQQRELEAAALVAEKAAVAAVTVRVVRFSPSGLEVAVGFQSMF